KRSHIKMSSIKGRSDDMLIIRGVNLFHTQVEVLLEDFEHLAPNYQLIVKREGNMDTVDLQVEVTEDLSSGIAPNDFGAHDRIQQLTKELSHKIKNNIGLSMKVELTPHDTIPRSVGGKLSRINDQRNLK
ncbi:MAG: phenylacetate--CoA ligase, partial [Bacteroidota bacterium]